MSINGFTEDGIAAFVRGRATNIIGMTGQNLYFVLSGEISLIDAITRKARGWLPTRACGSDFGMSMAA